MAAASLLCGLSCWYSCELSEGCFAQILLRNDEIIVTRIKMNSNVTCASPDATYPCTVIYPSFTHCDYQSTIDMISTHLNAMVEGDQMSLFVGVGVAEIVSCL